MADIIEDGTGSGNTAGVTVDNKLKTISTIHTEEHAVSLASSNGYFMSTGSTIDTLTVPDGFDGPILHLENGHATLKVITQKILCSANAAGLIFRFVRNKVEGTVTAGTSAPPTNMNFSSNNAADGSFHVWDETGTTGMGGLTGGITFKTWTLKAGPEFFPIDGAIVMDRGNSFSLEVANSTGGAIEFECGIRFYYNDREGE